MNTFFDLCRKALWMLYPFVRPLNTLIISEPQLVDFSIVMLERNVKLYFRGNNSL